MRRSAYVQYGPHRTNAQSQTDPPPLLASDVYYQSMVLAAVAGLLARIGSTSISIQLLGALERLRDDDQIIGAPHDLAMQQQLHDRLQKTFEPDTFAEQWAAGRRLTLDDAVSLARAELSQVAA